jgi:hypothetical protein
LKLLAEIEDLKWGAAARGEKTVATQCVAPVSSNTVLTTVTCPKALNNAIAQFFAHPKKLRNLSIKTTTYFQRKS